MARDAVGEIRERLDIVDLVQGYVPSLKKSGNTFKGLCPFHNEKTPSFIVFPDSQSFHCFGCGKGGDLFTFFMDAEMVDFREALQELAKRAGVELQPTAPRSPAEDDKRNRLVEINELASMWFHHILTKSGEGASGREVVTSRGVSPEMVEEFRLGFAPDRWDSLLNFLASRGMSGEEVSEAGLASPRDSGGFYDRFRGRLMFPIRNRDGETVGFGGRALDDTQPKYLNSPQTAIFDKSSLVYGLDLARDAIRESEQVVIVEGYMDAIAAHQFGFRNVVASMGTALTERQVSLIKRGTNRIVLALDADSAGQMATMRGLETVTGSLDADVRPVPSPNGLLQFERKLKTDISIVQLTAGKDPDEIIRKTPESWPDLVRGARPFLDFTIDMLTRNIDLNDPNAKSEVVRKVIPLLRQIPDPVKENHYARMLARRLDVSESVILTERHRPGVGGRTAAMRAGVAPTAAQMSRPRSNEDFLLALLIQHHQLNADVAAHIDEELILDARNRLVLDILRDPATSGLQGDELIAGMPDDLADYAESLLGLLERRPEQFPSHVVTETRQVASRLGSERFSLLMRELQRSLRSAIEAGDAEDARQFQEQINVLSKRRAAFDPVPSPYFKDLRTK